MTMSLPHPSSRTVPGMGGVQVGGRSDLPALKATGPDRGSSARGTRTSRKRCATALRRGSASPPGVPPGPFPGAPGLGRRTRGSRRGSASRPGLRRPGLRRPPGLPEGHRAGLSEQVVDAHRCPASISSSRRRMRAISSDDDFRAASACIMSFIAEPSKARSRRSRTSCRCVCASARRAA